MEKKSPSLSQIHAISQAELLISGLYEDPDDRFRGVIEVVEKGGVTELEDWMEYLYSLLFRHGYSEYAEEFAKRYNIHTAESDTAISPSQ